MLLGVGNFPRTKAILSLGMLAAILLGAAIGLFSRASTQPQQPSNVQTTSPGAGGSLPAIPAPASQSGAQVPSTSSFGVQTQRSGLNIVVLDPAHGGTDPGARGTGGIRESEIVLDMAAQVRRALELQGFQVIQTRQGNDNPSFDDRSAMANAQRGAVFVALHISSTGLPGTVRVYANSDMPPLTNSNGLIPWDRAQAPFLGLSRKFADLVQAQLAMRFKGSPPTAQTATVRQLRTTAAPAIAVEISSIVVDDRAQLDHMAQGVADSIAAGAAGFRPSYVVPSVPGMVP
jgi:N-acetylmuramoyl-L-alanine amidase